ncbi:MAG: hypothetical protein ABIZ34_00525 [Candidatus Limnocylindrales bacterium]
MALASLAALTGAAAAITEGTDQGLLMVGAVAATFVVSLGWDGWVGIVVGLLAAGLVTLIRQTSGTWLPQNFAPAALETIALVATGWSAGRVGQMLNAGRSGPGSDASAGGGVYGSLGMLEADVALVRLEEEVQRGSTYGRDLSLLLIEVELVGAEVDRETEDEVYRASARLTETLLRAADVPFSFSRERIGAILPETDMEAASIASGRILEALSNATFTDQRTRRRRRLADVASVHLALVSLGPGLPTAGELLDAALAGLKHRPDDDR